MEQNFDAGSATRVVDDIIRKRRTSMFVDDSEIDPSIVAELCELASWAPCHKKTWPWEFALLSGTARERFGNAIADTMQSSGDEPARVLKTRSKYLRAPAILVVSSATGDTPLRTVENRDATAAAIQNILLAATARGLASFWSSCPRGANDTVVDFCGFSEGSSVVGIIYLGRPTKFLDAPDRPAPHLRAITS